MLALRAEMFSRGASVRRCGVIADVSADGRACVQVRYEPSVSSDIRVESVHLTTDYDGLLLSVTTEVMCSSLPLQHESTESHVFITSC